MIATSIGSEISSMRQYAGTEHTEIARGFTGYTAPVKPKSMRLCRIW
jgi:hypothetical protein